MNKEKFFMGICESSDCPDEPQSVRFNAAHDGFFCWQCESDDTWRNAAFFVTLGSIGVTA